jgi:AsmA protein
LTKSVKIGVAVAIALPILAVAAIPLFVDANTFRPAIEGRLSLALARKVTVGDLRLSAMTGSLVASDFAIADDPKFGLAPFFTAKRLLIGVEMRPLLFKRLLVVRSFEADSPQVHLMRGSDGTWNFSTLSHGAGAQSTAQPGVLPELRVGRITIKDGKAQIGALPFERSSQILDHLDVKVDHFSLAEAFPFTVSASLPGEGKVRVSGTVGPLQTGTAAQDAASTPFDAQLTIEHLDPVAAGYVDPAVGISAIGGLDAHIVSDGKSVTSAGKLHAEHLVLLKGGKAAPHALDITYRIDHSVKGNSGQISDLALQTGAVAIHLKGTYELAANVPVFDLKLLAQSVPIDGLEAFMPVAGVKLPNGAALKGGTLSAHFEIQGTAKDNVITGSYEIRNTELVGYDLGSKIVGIAAKGGIKTGDTTAIEISRADIRVTKEGSESTNIYSVLPALGESTGSGTVSPSGALDFHLISKVANAKGLNKLGVEILTKLNGSSSAVKPSTASGIPIDITGTAENPVITADIHGLVKGNEAAFRSKSADIFDKDKTRFSNLFRKKKQPIPPPGR